MTSDNADWSRYLAAFHGRKPGITERVLRRVHDPYGWLTEPVRESLGWIVDLACGSAPTREYLADRGWMGVDLSRDELAVATAAGRRPVVQARADALPVADGAAATVCSAMALQAVTPLSDVLAEVKRVLRPGGLLVALVPARLGFPPRGWWSWMRIFATLGVGGQPWPNPHACDRLPAVLVEHGFEIVSSQRRTFWYPVDTPEAAALLVDSLYLPGVSAKRIATAQRILGLWARPGRHVPLPLRRVIARAQQEGAEIIPQHSG